MFDHKEVEMKSLLDLFIRPDGATFVFFGSLAIVATVLMAGFNKPVSSPPVAAELYVPMPVRARPSQRAAPLQAKPRLVREGLS